MVDASNLEGLRQELRPQQFRSADSSPASFSHPLPVHVAPMVIGIFAILSLLLFTAFRYSSFIAHLFPQGDLFLSNYSGGFGLPLRLFFVAFFIAFAFGISAPWYARTMFAFKIIALFLLTCALFDLSHSVLSMILHLQASHFAAHLVTALAAFMLFALLLLDTTDLPSPARAPFTYRFKLPSLMLALGVLSASALIAFWAIGAHPRIIEDLRSIALLGGVNIGVFLLLPLVFFFLNVLDAIKRALIRTTEFYPDITLVIPALNEAHTIEPLIHTTAAAAADYPGQVTILLVDNNSTDDTAAKATACLQEAGGIKYEVLHEPRPGKAFALNCGLAHVETDYFARLDADTLISSETLRRSFTHFADERTGVVGGLAIPPGGGPFDGSREIEVLLKMGYDQTALSACDGVFGIAGMFACYRTKAARDVGGFAVGINGEDTDMALRIGESGYRLLVDPTVVFISEVPRTLRHLREQRQRWFRSLFYVAARNRRYLFPVKPTTRGWLIMPYMLANTARRAMALPLLFFATAFLVLQPINLASTINTASVVALLLGAPLLNAILAIIVNLRFAALASLGPYIFFRLLRSYFTLEALLSLNFRRYAKES